MRLGCDVALPEQVRRQRRREREEVGALDHATEYGPRRRPEQPRRRPAPSHLCEYQKPQVDTLVQFLESASLRGAGFVERNPRTGRSLRVQRPQSRAIASRKSMCLDGHRGWAPARLGLYLFLPPRPWK